MYIRSFRVKNFMIHRDTEVGLFPVTVLVGPNNGGKSAFFDALLNFSMVSRGRLAQAFGPGPFSYAALRHHGASAVARVGFDVRMSEAKESEREVRYQVSYEQHGGETGAYIIFDESLEVDGAIVFVRSNADAFPMGGTVRHLSGDRSIFAAIRAAQLTGEYEEADPLVTLCAREISRLTKYRLDPATLSRPSRTPQISTENLEASPTPRIDYRGEDLPSVLYYLSETQSPAMGPIVERLTECLSGFEGFQFNTIGTDRIGFSVQFADPRGVVPAANLSDGTLSLIGMMALLLTPDRPSVMCIEEPENGLTPRATRAVYEAIRDLAFNEDLAARSQILISSHSPFVICAAWNGEDRDFIYHMKEVDGDAIVRTFGSIIGEHEIPLAKQEGERRLLSLNTADQILEGYYS